jgi:hypothetical protein
MTHLRQSQVPLPLTDILLLKFSLRLGIPTQQVTNIWTHCTVCFERGRGDVVWQPQLDCPLMSAVQVRRCRCLVLLPPLACWCLLWRWCWCLLCRWCWCLLCRWCCFFLCPLVLPPSAAASSSAAAWCFLLCRWCCCLLWRCLLWRCCLLYSG